MKTLLLDSATNVLYAALCIEDKLIYESYTPGKNDHASVILVEAEQACKKAGIDLKDINQVIVGIGPGSYTGVRMAVTVGKMVATLEPKIKLFTISTLKLMASGTTGNVLSWIDARRGNCFGCIYNPKEDTYRIEEALQEKRILENQQYDCVVDENSFKVDPFRVIELAEEVLEPRILIPNYLRETEAERNLHD